MNTNRIPAEVGRLLDAAEAVELYSLVPDHKPVPAGVEAFHGWRVLGKSAVKAADRKPLAAGLRQAAEDNHGVAAACFNPRHGLRLTAGKMVVDLVICFECIQVQAYVDGKRADGFLTTRDPQPGFDGVLKTAGVELPNAAGE
jgi:hypothetical protein